MQAVICSPEEYYSDAFQNFIEAECAAANSQWIYHIITNTFASNREQVFIHTAQWCLCADQHLGHDPSYLVIFKTRISKPCAISGLCIFRCCWRSMTG